MGEVPAVAVSDPDASDSTLHLTGLPLPRWTAPVFMTLVLGLVPWIVWLGVSLPRKHTVGLYDLSWVGFDVGLLLALAAVGWLAQRRSPYVEIAATAAGTLLVVDAWFDITTASPGLDRWEAIGSALVVELPIAVLCWWLARNAEAVRQRRHESLLSRLHDVS